MLVSLRPFSLSLELFGKVILGHYMSFHALCAGKYRSAQTHVYQVNPIWRIIMLGASTYEVIEEKVIGVLGLGINAGDYL